MNPFMQDLRYSVRQLRKNPGFAAVSVLTIALGIGAATAMFSLVDRILFRSLPYPNDNELVSIGVTAPIIDGEFLFAANYLDWRQHQTALRDFTSVSGVNDCDLTEDHPVRLACAAVSSTFLPTFGIQPVLGRNFTHDEDQPKAPKVALITFSLWQGRFGGDPGIIGRMISMDGQPTQIIGILPGDFEYPNLAHTDVIVPQALDETIVQQHQMGPVVRVFGRTKPNQSVEQARAALEPLFSDFVRSAPPQFRQVLRLQVRSIRDLQVHDSHRAAWLLLLAALAVLLIACANAANLILARSAARRQELAVRSALGASRMRIFRQRLTESIALAILGGAAGVTLAYFIIHSFVAIAPASIPHLSQASVDPRILIFALVMSLVSGILFGTAPALEKPGQLSVISTLAAPRGRMRQLLLVTQVWMAVVLLASAFLFVRSLRNLETDPLGINTQNVVSAAFTLGEQKYSTAKQRLAFFEQVEARVHELPGIHSAAFTDSLPPTTPIRTMPFFALQTEGEPAFAPGEGIGGIVGWRSVTPDYFSVLGIPLIRGRAFNEQDRDPSNHAIILNEALARRLFPNGDPLGKVVQFHVDRAVLSVPFTVVGITANTQNQGLGGQAGPEYYMVRRHTEDDVVFNYPDSQRLVMVVRSAMQAQAVADELRTAVAQLDPTVPVEATTLSQSVAQLAARPRFSAALLSLFAVVGMLLTAVGIYGVVSLLVNQRTQEIGIRMALGATRGEVVAMMVRQAAAWIAVGAAAGAAGSMIAARWIRSLLFGVEANDPLTLAASAIALVLVAIVAAWIPARRSAKVDPLMALHYE